MTSLMHRFALSVLFPVVAGLAMSALLVWGLVRVAPTETAPEFFVGATGILVTGATAAAVEGQRRAGAATHEHLRDMERRATHDPLTGLPSREEFITRLEKAIVDGERQGNCTGLLYLDLDGFKSINDSMGHEAGDDLLRVFAARLRNSVRASDVVGRLGGDEFAVVCTGVREQHQVKEVAENIRLTFSDPLEISAGSVMVIPSVGVATSTIEERATAQELLAQGDQAMYRAKRGGGGVEVFDDAQRQEDFGRREMDRSIGPAIAAGEFEVHYQPIVSQSRSAVVAFEGLIRWQHPIHGLLAPDRFLSVAEENGMITRLGEAVLREATAQTAVWNYLRGAAGGPAVGINLAERQLVDPSFPDRVAEVIRWAGIPPSQLNLEVREQLLVRRVGDRSRVLQRLAGLGCRIVIDDFGNANGAFSRLRDLDLVDMIKIDRSVIARVAEDEVSRAVVESSVSMAEALGVGLVAEGVETETQRSIVTDLGIDLMQGFLFREPIESSTIERDGLVLVQAGRADDN